MCFVAEAPAELVLEVRVLRNCVEEGLGGQRRSERTVKTAAGEFASRRLTDLGDFLFQKRQLLFELLPHGSLLVVLLQEFVLQSVELAFEDCHGVLEVGILLFQSLYLRLG